MSDVMAEDRERAHDLARGVYRCNDPHMNKQHSEHCGAIATALATVRKEARREALKEALNVANGFGWECGDEIKDAIRALMEPQ